MRLPIAHFGTLYDLTGETWDAATLTREVARRTGTLARFGITRGDRVAIAHSNSTRFVADLLSVWGIGATASCLDESLTPGELARVMGFLNASLLLVDRDPATVLLDGIDVEIENLAEIQGSAHEADGDGHLDDPALILFTSGTTGTPKGVVLSHRAILARTALNAAFIGRDALACSLVTLPTHFGHGLIGNTLTPLLAGADVILHPPGLVLAQSLGRIVDDHGITFMSSVPSFWRMVLKSSAPPGSRSLRRVHVGSAPLSASLWREIADWSSAEVINCYGLTETANWFSGASPREGDFEEGLLGRPWGGTAAVRSDDGRISLSGEGEIVLQSPSLMQGYLDRPDLTEAALVDGWYRTGDLGSVDADGRIRISGRLKDEINRAGFKIQPAEIDSLLETHGDIAEACVFGLSDPVSGEIVAAAVQLEAGATVDEAALMAWCRERLRPMAVPERWFIVDAIPRNARGKVSRDAVRSAFTNAPAVPANGIRPPLPVSPTDLSLASPSELSREAVVAAVHNAWTKTVGQEALTENATWDEAGGDSLKAMHAWFLIEDALGQRLPMEAFREESRPNELVDAILSAGCGPRTDDGTPLVFFFPPATGDMPGYAGFRSELSEQMRFHVVAYPDFEATIASDFSFDAIVERTVVQVQSVQPDGPLRLSGYSFGGCVAWEAARRLAIAGRQISFLGLIDTWNVNLRWPDNKHSRQGVARQFARILNGLRLLGSSDGRIRLTRKGLGQLVALRANWALRAAGKAATVLPSQMQFELKLWLIDHLRTIALKRHGALNSASLPVALFRTNAEPKNAPDLGWADQTDALSVVYVGGSHHIISDPKQRRRLCARFAESVHAAVDIINDGHEVAGLAPSVTFPSTTVESSSRPAA